MALIREEDRFYTTKEMAEALGVSSMTIRRLMKSGKLSFIKIGKILRFPANQLRKLEENGK